MDFFAGEIHKWYFKNKRDLPWRNTSDPYLIWVSEIMLQQTRVNQAIDYYHRFTGRFPDVKSLADASEDEVLKFWQGLGYYSRARNMHETARKINIEYRGKFPNEFKDLSKLKGIGKYTAAAIASAAFNIPFAAVDGNVARVISRYFGIEIPVDSVNGGKAIQAIADDLIRNEIASIHNQAMMEFGALQCTPKSPDCSKCPLSDSCFAFNKQKVQELPVKSKKVKLVNRYFYYYIIICNNSVLMEKRTGNDIWKNMYQFPLIETSSEISDFEILNHPVPGVQLGNFNIKTISAVKKHQLTHQTIFARFIYVETNAVSPISGVFQTGIKHIAKFAVPKLLEEEVIKLSSE